MGRGPLAMEKGNWDNTCTKTHRERVGGLEELLVKRVRVNKRAQCLSTLCFVLYFKVQ